MVATLLLLAQIAVNIDYIMKTCGPKHNKLCVKGIGDKAPSPWRHRYPCNLEVIDYGNGDVYIVNTAPGPVYGSSQLYHHRKDAERSAERIERESTCTDAKP